MTDQKAGAGSVLGAETLTAYFAADRQQQLEVAVALENLADSLPSGLEPRAIAKLLASTAPSWAAHRSFQEDFLFPLILRRNDGHAPTLAQLDLLRLEHLSIEGCNDEVVEQLGLNLGGMTPNSDMLGYLLRNAFESRRRHIVWEGNFIARLLPKILVPVERDMLEAWIAEQSNH